MKQNIDTITQTKPVKKLVMSLSNPPLLERRFSHSSNTFPIRTIGFPTLRRSFCTKRELKMYHLIQKSPSSSSDFSMNLLVSDLEEKRKLARSQKLAFSGFSTKQFSQNCFSEDMTQKQNGEGEGWVAMSMSQLGILREFSKQRLSIYICNSVYNNS